MCQVYTANELVCHEVEICSVTRQWSLITSSCDLVGSHHQVSRARPGFPTAISNPELCAKCSREKNWPPSNGNCSSAW